MIRIKKYTPCFVDIDQPDDLFFEDMEDLFKDYTDIALYNDKLFELYNNGFSWYMIGTISGHDPALIPSFKPKYKVKMPDGSIKIVNEIKSSRLDSITLLDGTVGIDMYWSNE